MSTRKLVIYGGVILLSLTTIFAIVASSGSFKAAEVATTGGTDGAGSGTGNGGTGTSTVTQCIIEAAGVAYKGVNWLGASVALASDKIGLANTDCGGGTCSAGNPPSDVPGSVASSGRAADATAQGTQSEIEAVKAATKTDIEAGAIKAAIEAAGKTVYADQAAAKAAMQKVWDYTVIPNLRIEYYQAGWNKVNARTTTSASQAKGFFGSAYSRDPNKWGPQANGQYTFLRNGNANLTGRATIGGFTYNGQSLGSGFADLSLTGTWNILGDTLVGVASYTCEIGDASGNTSVTGKWQTLGVRANIPVWIKSGDKAARITFQFGFDFIDKKVTLPFALQWKF